MLYPKIEHGFFITITEKVEPMILKSYFLFVIIFLVNIGCSVKENEKDFSNLSKSNDKLQVTIPARYDSLKHISAYLKNINPPYEILFKKVTAFGESEDMIFKGLSQFAIDDQDQVYIVNSKRIEVFNPAGDHIKILGGKGRGPGEFSNMGSLQPRIRAKKLFVYDDVLKRVNVYQTNLLEYANAININPKQWSQIPELQLTFIQDFFVFNDSLLLFAFEDLPNENPDRKLFLKYYKLNHEGKVVSEEVFRYKKNLDNTTAVVIGNRKFFPFHNASGRYMQVDFGPDNYIYTSRTEDFLIKIHSPTGEYVRAIYYPYQNRPLNKNDIIDTYSHSKNALQNAKDHEYPDTWPAIDYFFVDDEGRIWVATIIDDENNYEWWVLENSGKLLAKFKWPGKRLERHRRFRVYPKVKNGYFYDRKVDSTTSLRKIVKYKIHFKKR